MKKLLIVCTVFFFATSCGTSASTQKTADKKEKKETSSPANKNGYETVDM